MPRVFRPKSTVSPYRTDLLEGFIQLEIVVGGMALAAGGFLLRESGRYDGLIVGGTLLVLGLYRLWKRYEERESRLDTADRVLTQLRKGLSADHTVSLEYPVNGDRIPYLVLSPAGVFVVARFEERGYFEGERDEPRWRQWSRDPRELDDSGSPTTIPNPLFENRRRIRALRRRLRETRSFQDLDPLNRVVVIHGRVEGPVREYEEVCSPGELPDRIRSHESDTAPLDWEDLNELENVLKLENYE